MPDMKALGFTPHPANRVAPCKQANLAQLLLDLTAVRVLGALGQPLRRAIAFQLLVGKSLWTLLADILFRFSDGIGWLSAPPRDPVLRGVGRGIISVRRWHYTLGEPSCLDSLCAFHASVLVVAVIRRVCFWACAAGVLVFTAARKLIQRAREANDPGVQQRKKLTRAMEEASSYEEWSVAATKLDQVEGISPEEKKTRWKRETKLYDRRLLEERLRHLRAVRKGGRVSEMMFAVRADLLRNLGNMANR